MNQLLLDPQSDTLPLNHASTHVIVLLGITERVAVDEHGDRVADFDILDMTSPETREFQVSSYCFRKMINFRSLIPKSQNVINCEFIAYI